jgi:hypothetical protein
LVYEIGDPRCYRTPDIDIDFTTLAVREAGENRVAVTNASGKSPSDFYKVSLAYRDGFFASGELLVAGRDCVTKAKSCAEIILQRLAAAGIRLARTHVEILGNEAGLPTVLPREFAGREVMLRIAAHDPNRAAVERFTREFAPLITRGPAGLAGYAAGRPTVRPVFAYWPTLVPKALVPTRTHVATAQAWHQRGQRN